MMNRKSILVVDDVIINLQYAEHALKDTYDVITSSSGADALLLLAMRVPDLILLDINMPGMDGYETLERIRQIPAAATVPVIFITAETRTENEIRAFEMGALDVIHKPFAAKVMKARINTQLELRDYREQLEHLVRRKTSALERFQDVMSTCIAELIESRDGTTGFHIRNTTKYFKIFVEELSKREPYNTIFSGKYIADLFRGAPLHDIGKVGIRDDILRKPSALTREEFHHMKSHAKIGGDAFGNMLTHIQDADMGDWGENASNVRNTELGFLYAAKDMALCHHEKWDGTGYPNGLEGNEIPLSARILAIADVYDALTAKRPYKETYSHEESMRIIEEGRGTFFDPYLTDVFIEISDRIRECLMKNQKMLRNEE